MKILNKEQIEIRNKIKTKHSVDIYVHVSYPYYCNSTCYGLKGSISFEATTESLTMSDFTLLGSRVFHLIYFIYETTQRILIKFSMEYFLYDSILFPIGPI